MPPQNVGTSMNLQIVLNTPKKSVLESSHTEKIFAKLFYKKKKAFDHSHHLESRELPWRLLYQLLIILEEMQS